MTPKETLQAAFETGISPHLLTRGFRYVRSQFTYKRRAGDFTQQISITLSHHNTAERIEFCSGFYVSSPDYNKWRQQQGIEKFDGYLGWSMDWNIPGWRSQGDPISFCFSPPEQRDAVLAEWLRRCLSAGIGYLDNLSSWEGLGDDLLRSRWHWGRAADYFLIAGKPDKAIAAMEAGIDFLLKQDHSYSESAHPILVMKKQRQEKERDMEVRLYRHRIAQLKR